MTIIVNPNTSQAQMSIEKIAREKLHHKDGRFFNPWCNDCEKKFGDIFKWKFAKNIYAEEKKKGYKFNVVTPDFLELSKSNKDYAVWLGQSTVLMKIGDITIITDPVFGDIGVSFFQIKRKTPFPISPERLPKIDFVLISHGHYDHLDTKSIEFLKKHSDPVFITGPGYADYFASLDIKKYIMLDWWEKFNIKDTAIISLPVQHWSKRGLWDKDKMLWCSFLIEKNGRKFYWIGDTGYYYGFKEIGEKFGPIDVLFVPTGSYEPRWFMKKVHVNPEEAIQIAQDVKARNFIPLHWGTFDLTDEPLWLPIKHLKEIYPAAEKNPHLIILDHGGSYIFP